MCGPGSPASRSCAHGECESLCRISINRPTFSRRPSSPPRTKVVHLLIGLGGGMAGIEEQRAKLGGRQRMSRRCGEEVESRLPAECIVYSVHRLSAATHTNRIQHGEQQGGFVSCCIQPLQGSNESHGLHTFACGVARISASSSRVADCVGRRFSDESCDLRPRQQQGLSDSESSVHSWASLSTFRSRAGTIDLTLTACHQKKHVQGARTRLLFDSNPLRP